jgi:hypothetical protein
LRIVSPRKSILSRFILPGALVLATMGASTIAYNLSWRINNHDIHQAVAFVAGILLFLSIGFGTLLIYPVAFFRGAGVAERILACLATPVVWNLKEMVRVSEFFTLGEALYYGLNPTFILTVIGTFAQMGLCEMLCRRTLRRRGETQVKVVSALPLTFVILGIMALFVMLVWGRGVHGFYLYMEGYKALLM